MATMTAPKISVVLPVYNAEQHIKEAVDSILKQSFQDFELLLMNDGSSDNSLQVMQEHYGNNEQVQIIDQTNHGLIYTLNKAISLAKGELIARMDADDIAFPERFAKQVALFDADPDLVLCSSSTQNFGAETNLALRSDDNDELKALLLFWPPFAHPAAMFKRSAFTEHKVSYDENYKHCEDFALWSELAPLGRFSNVTEVMLNYRVHENQVTNTFPETVLDAHYRICQKNLAALKVTFDKSSFLAYLGKERHAQGFAQVLGIYQSIIAANQSLAIYQEATLCRVIAKLVGEQIENFYGIAGLSLVKKDYPKLYQQLAIGPLLIKAIRRDLIRLIRGNKTK